MENLKTKTETTTQYAPFRQRPDGSWHKLTPFHVGKIEAERIIEEHRRHPGVAADEKCKIMKRTVTTTFSEWEDA